MNFLKYWEVILTTLRAIFDGVVTLSWGLFGILLLKNQIQGNFELQRLLVWFIWNWKLVLCLLIALNLFELRKVLKKSKGGLRNV